MPIDGVYVTLESVPHGGGHEAIKQSLQEYEKRGLDVRAICPYVPGVGSCLPNSIPIRLESLAAGQNPMDYSGRFERIKELCKKSVSTVKRLKPDVMISHTYHGSDLFKKFPGTRRVYRDSALKKYMLEIAGKYGIKLPYGSNGTDDLIKIEKTTIENCDDIKTTSTTSAKWLETEYKIDNSKIHIIPEPVDTSKFKKNSKEKNTDILFAARCKNPVKGFDVISKALNILTKEKGMQLEVDVFGNEDPFKQYESMIKELGLEKSIKYRGFVPHEKMSSIYSGAKLLIVPSYFESFGMSCTEGMSCETPVIVSDVGGLKDQLEGWEDQKFTPGNHHELAEKIASFFNGQTDYSKWGQRERKRVETRYELSKIIDMEIEAFFN
ncbi:MAG: glycosyltransferase family 4 protein [Candidatus Aenigmatarchaeota archaeon]